MKVETAGAPPLRWRLVFAAARVHQLTPMHPCIISPFPLLSLTPPFFIYLDPPPSPSSFSASFSLLSNLIFLRGFAMDPCPFFRVVVENLALKSPSLLPSKSAFSLVHPSSSPFFCKIKLGNFPTQYATVPLILQEFHPSDEAVSFTLSRADVEKLGEKILFSSREPRLQILVYTGRRGRSCGLSSGKLLGSVTVGLDLKGAEGRACVFHNGWVSIGEHSAQLFLSVRAEPDPRFVFRFGGKPECSPQVFQIQGNLRQAVFTCKFSFRNSGDRCLRSRLVPSTDCPFLCYFWGSDLRKKKVY